MEEKRYPIFEEEENAGMASEPVAALATTEVTEISMPDDMDCAHIVDGVLQVHSDIEEEIAEAERGEVVTMSEFKTMFAKWLDQ